MAKIQTWWERTEPAEIHSMVGKMLWYLFFFFFLMLWFLEDNSTGPLLSGTFQKPTFWNQPSRVPEKYVHSKVNHQGQFTRGRVLGEAAGCYQHQPCTTENRHRKKLKNICTKKTKKYFQKDICTPMFIATLLTIINTWKQPKCLPMEEWIKKMCCIILPW